MPEECAGGYCDTTYSWCMDNSHCLNSEVCNVVYNRCEYYCIGLLAEDEPCTFGYECESGTCVLDVCKTVPLADGEPCSSDWHCESEFCNLEDERVCETTPLPNGSGCWSHDHCVSGVCHNQECSYGLQDGQICDSPSDPPCAPGLFCDWRATPPYCARIHEPGELCRDDWECRLACTLRYNRFMCDPTPAEGSAICDGSDA
jgi:hypothetical protein